MVCNVFLLSVLLSMTDAKSPECVPLRNLSNFLLFRCCILKMCEKLCVLMHANVYRTQGDSCAVMI